MPVIGNALDFSKYEARNFRAHILGAAPSSPVTGQLYYNSGDNTLYWYDGTTWVSGRGGVVADATASVKGVVQLAGDLAGTAASPQIAAGVITDADVNANNKDGSVGMPSMRTLGAGSTQAMPGDRKLDQVNPPNGPVNLNNQRITTLADPTAATDAVNRQYLDNQIATSAGGLSWKQTVRAATTVNLASLTGTPTVDTVVLAVGDRVMVKNQTSQAANGIYIVAAGAWTRATDFDTWAKMVGSAHTVQQSAGSVNGGSIWAFGPNPGGTVGTTSIFWNALPKGITGFWTGTQGLALDASVTLENVGAPTGPLNVTNQRITNLADPISTTDGANKRYVDSTIGSLNYKGSVRAASTANVVLSTSGAALNVDGVIFGASNQDDRVLLKDQTAPAENGIYFYDYFGATSYQLTRVTDANSWPELVSAAVWVQQGTANGDTEWYCTVNTGGTIGTTAVTWRMVPSSIVTAWSPNAGAVLGGMTPLDGLLPPSGSVNFGAQRAFNLGTPTGPSDAATKDYVDTFTQGLDAKASVRAATTANITLSGAQTIDGANIIAGQRVLVKNQTALKDNGIYVAASGAWTRATDADTGTELNAAYVFVEEGTTQTSSGWVCNFPTGAALGADPVIWTQFSGAGQITPGGGLTKSGNVLDVGAGAGITVNADTIQVSNNGITNAMIADGAIDVSTADVTGILPVAKGGTGQASFTAVIASFSLVQQYRADGPPSAGATWTITQSAHNLTNARNITVQVVDNTSGNVEIPDIKIASNGDVTITYGVSVAQNSKRVILVG